jgi:hypothetical protein
MKSDKKKLVKRNPFVTLAIKRKAGSHDKPYKAKRGALNREGWGD